MCIAVFLWKSHPQYPFLLLLNRDEYHNRETTALGWWDDDGEILGGRDGKAGGTWLGTSRGGKIAFLTNVREIGSPSPSISINSRGHLPLRFLKSTKSPKEFGEELVVEAAHNHFQYGGFNLIVADFCSMTMFYITNRPKDNGGNGLSLTQVSPGIHVLSNAKLDTPWPKAQRLRYSFEEAVNKCGEAEIISVKEMTEKLMNDTTKDDDESMLPRIYPSESEYHLSSIFVEAVDTALGRYGTRSTSAVVLQSSTGEVCFYERNLEKDVWKEQTISYLVGSCK